MNLTKVLSVEDLIGLFKSSNFSHFSSKEAGGIIKLRSRGMFEMSEQEDGSVLNVWLKSCHIDDNLNHSYISKSSMETAMPSFKGKPILGSIIKDEETGEYDFNGHDMTIKEDEDGNTYVEYIEQIIGAISEIDDPYLEYCKDNDKTYVMVHGRIFDTYTKAAEIMRRRKTCSCSVELSVSEVSFDAKNDWLVLEAFEFEGVTILGEKVSPGMKGASISIDSFSQKSDGENYKLIEVLEKLNTTLSNFDTNKTTITKEGGTNMDEFKETVVEEEETKEVDEAEATEDTTTEEETTTETEPASEDSGEETEITETEACGGKKKKKKCSVDENGDVTLEWELSHDDIRSALFNLLWAEDDWCWIVDVYDDKFIYENEDECKFYRRGYTKDGNNISLSDEKTEVFNEWLSQTEKDVLDALKNDYTALQAYKSNMEQSQKDTIFASDKYVALKSSKAFAKLIEEAKNYSVEECSQKADELLDEAKKLVEQFAAVKPVEETHTPKTVGINFKQDVEKKDCYGGLFSDFKKKHGK